MSSGADVEFQHRHRAPLLQSLRLGVPEVAPKITMENDAADLPRGQLAAEPLVKRGVGPLKGVRNRVEIGVGQLCQRVGGESAGSNGRGNVRWPCSVASRTMRPPARSTRAKNSQSVSNKRTAQNRQRDATTAPVAGRWPPAVRPVFFSHAIEGEHHLRQLFTARRLSAQGPARNRPSRRSSSR